MPNPNPDDLAEIKDAFEDTHRTLDSLVAAIYEFSDCEAVDEALPPHWQEQMAYISEEVWEADKCIGRHREKYERLQD